MTFLENLTDNQTAMLGCVGMLLAAFVTMAASYHVGLIVRGGQTSTVRSQRRRIQAAGTSATPLERDAERRAA